MNGAKLSANDIATACKLRGLRYEQDGTTVSITRGPVTVTLHPEEYPPDGFELIDALYAIDRLANQITANQHLEASHETV